MSVKKPCKIDSQTPVTPPSVIGGEIEVPESQEQRLGVTKPPVLLIRQEYLAQLQAMHKALNPADGAAVNCQVTQLGTRVMLTSMTAHSEYKKLLEQNGIPFQGGPKKKFKTRRIVIKGIDPSVDPLEIQNDLSDLGYQVLKVVNMTSARTKGPLPMFMAVLMDDSTAGEAEKVKRLCFYKVKIEGYRRITLKTVP
ncbi:hypothetical protein L9F63_010691 [Diploptera punctata]|uniref:Pre-C2HC domain-containing protein n=1 Tax=Diploptera punctata TaxID=6984 RepID=A0AAD8AHC5_DIPPU|nr:hypothetical protein L9F63_010691 [Diploptera punctata]